MKEAALECKSITDYALHALDADGEKLPITLALENISTLLGAGQVTTSSLLAWLLMVLADHKDEAEALYAALLDAGLRTDSEPTIEELQKVERLDWFIKETQRLYNPAFQPTRCALQGEPRRTHSKVPLTLTIIYRHHCTRRLPRPRVIPSDRRAAFGHGQRRVLGESLEVRRRPLGH